jgi:hypothetical protein
LVVGVGAAVVAAATFALIRPASGSDSPHASTLAAETSRATAPKTPTQVAPSSSMTDTPLAGSSPTATASGPALIDSTTALAVLNQLDSVRQRAFAQRDVPLLDQVYVAGDLRDQDSATLTRLVAPGCSLHDVHTVYSDVRLVAAATGQVAVAVTAALSKSTLTCGAGNEGNQAPSTTLPGTGPTLLRIELTRTAAGYLISAQQVVGP